MLQGMCVGEIGEGQFVAKHKAYLSADQFSEQIKHRSGGGVCGPPVVRLPTLMRKDGRLQGCRSAVC